MIAAYFAYGSNMNPARVAARGLAVLACGGARLTGVRLVFDKASREDSLSALARGADGSFALARGADGSFALTRGADGSFALTRGADGSACAHANLAFARDGVVEGVLYRLVDADEIRKMDPFERTPINYSREAVTVDTLDGPVVAWTYFANPGVCRAGLRPERSYLEHMLAGRPYLSDPYFSWLRAVACQGDA